MSQPQEEPNEPRELTPVQMFWDGRDGVVDFGPRVMSADTPTPVTEAVVGPVPKDDSALASVASSGSPPINEQSELAMSAQRARTPVTLENPEDADKENGKPNESTVPNTPEPTSPPPVPSLPDSSSVTPTKPGSPEPPAPVKPPTVASPPTQ